MQRSSLALAFTGLLALAATSSISAMPQQTSSAQAQPVSGGVNDNHTTQGVPSFGDLDKDHDGFLTRGDIPKDVEGLKPLRAHFTEADKDHNGRLNPNEYAGYVQTQVPTSEKPPGQN